MPPADRHALQLTWKICLLCLLVSVLVVLSIPFVARVVRDVRWRRIKPQMVTVVSTLAPVLDACELYRRHNGKYPHDLSHLVPRYLNAIPEAPPPFHHVTSSNLIRKFGDNSVCELLMSVPREFIPEPGLLSFDVLLFRSDGRYPEAIPGYNYYDRVGRWAYYTD